MVSMFAYDTHNGMNEELDHEENNVDKKPLLQ